MKAAEQSAGTTSVRLVWPFLELARKAGHAERLKRVPELLGLTQAQLDDPNTRISQRVLARMLARAIDSSGNRDIGLLAAQKADSQHIGINEYIARSRATMQDAIEANVRYVRLLGDVVHHGLEIQGKLAYSTFRLDPELAGHPAAYEYVLALAVLRARRITGDPDLAPIEVHFTHAQPADTTRHEKLFRCRLRFGMPVAQLVMSAKFLKRPMARAEPALGELLETQATAMLERLPRSNELVAHVTSMLRAEGSLRGASAERIARRLGMSVRTLSRKLGEERTSYRALFDDARRTAAVRDLTQSERPIAEIAYDLGFASTQSFHRAFRRWTGMTASACRSAARERSGRRGRARA